ncbi:low molecular weight protein arginine phosphatase [Saccharibacillus sp. CPCC 101409]|uniref:low molecular weight protein arginine phosphatase n=1 Tax=Saccharibacillus sp. CPCC 101409 TaxID=3058041 RepID=UPI0026729938|nr:low molecular weight protein arginine phosphatase [Saccharibacillus sp. CPCC 101409]MDO3412128.1 low molecular weight protein arginine phosphatase [Saccharibacillus sp. CPCC 101409]
MRRILFVCTGNTCRSPMAEALLRRMAKQREIEVEVRSAGVSASLGVPISRHAEAVLRDHSIGDRITSSPLDRRLVEWADLILTLTGAHKSHVLRYFPDAFERTYTLKEYVEDDGKVLADLQELDSLHASAELARALGETPDANARQRMIELRQRIPSFDISDPFGGSRDDYEATAAEIRTALDRLLDKWDAQK